MKRHFVRKEWVTVDNRTSNTWLVNLSHIECEEEVRQLIRVALPSEEDQAAIVDVQLLDEQNQPYALVTVDKRRVVDRLIDQIEGKYMGAGRRVHMTIVTSKDQDNQSQLPYSQPFGAISVNDWQQMAGKKKRSKKANEIKSPVDFIQSETKCIVGDNQPHKDNLVVCCVKYPATIKQLRLIHRVIENVVRYGPPFEALLMQKYRLDVRFEFLFNTTTADHVYYRWKLYMILSTGNLKTGSLHLHNELFDGVIFVPPSENPPDVETEISDIDSVLESVSSVVPNKNINNLPFLGYLSALHLYLLLRNVSYRRGSIARVTGFAVHRSNASSEIVEIIANTITGSHGNGSDDSRTKVALLWVIGDILCNVDIASPYRVLFQKALPNIFTYLRDYTYTVLLAQHGRLSNDRFKRQVLDILDSWTKFSVFTRYDLCSISDLRNIFLGTDTGQKDDVTDTTLQDDIGVSSSNSFTKTVLNDNTVNKTKQSQQPDCHSPTPGSEDGDPLTEEEIQYYKHLIKVGPKS